MNRSIAYIKLFLRERFNLDEDKATELEIISNIKKDVEFKGTNLWVLIFAVFIASIGLNVNSTAVIIGAMLISPLMGPIMGIGLGVAIYDFELIKKAARNLSIAIILSVITSTFYFLITPLSEAKSELLARTTPTIWDVFIAFFGGMAGIVAGTRKEKSNVIPGVAIATALMPPLSTAGYGLATGNLGYFIGALYLFFINSVFISLSSLLIVRFLKFPKTTFVNIGLEQKVKRYIWIIVVITLIPSIYLGINIVKRTIFNQNAQLFIKKELFFPKSQLISKTFEYSKDKPTIDVIFVGDNIDEKLIEMAQSKLKNYGLDHVQLNIRQGYQHNNIDMNVFKAGIIEELYKKNEEELKNKDQKIAFLENELINYKLAQIPIKDLAEEVKAEHQFINKISVNKSIIVNLKTNELDTVLVAITKFSKWPSRSEQNRLKNWLKVRTKSNAVKLIVE